MKFFFQLVVAINFFQLFMCNSHAESIRERAISLRAMGMGGVYASAAKGADALFYNPAAMGLDSGITFEILNFGAALNGIDAATQISQIQADPAAGINAYMGTEYWLVSNARAAVVTPRFGFGAYNNLELNLALHDPILPKVQTTYINDMAYVIGGSFPLAKNTYFGVNLQQINRTGGTQDISASTLTNQAALQNLASQFQDTGQGYGADIAMVHRIPGSFDQTFTGVWENVGGTAFRPTSVSNTSPPYIVGNHVLGYSISQDLPGLDWVGALEFRHINNNDHELAKKLHLGFEFSLPFIDIRYGLNQGYNAYGVGMDMLFVRFDVAYYDEEIGVYVGQTKQNRVAASLTFDLSFDANFNLQMADYRTRRKLKQRR